jgi:hypothetical protein
VVALRGGDPDRRRWPLSFVRSLQPFVGNDALFLLFIPAVLGACDSSADSAQASPRQILSLAGRRDLLSSASISGQFT